jgi:hypothetical protein
MVPDLKTCFRCNTEKASSDFFKIKSKHDGLHTYCKRCDRIIHLERRYGLTEERFNEMLRSQGGACAICKFIPGPKDRPLDVDHHHTTGVIRGLLCGRCNRGIGFFRDSPVIVRGAIEYLCGEPAGPLYKTPVPREIKGSILLSQNYTCKICRIEISEDKACVDHCHKTKTIRGCLCGSCNSGLGQLRDSVSLVQNTVAYLSRST